MRQKISPASGNLKETLQYNFKKVEAGEASVLDANRIAFPIDADMVWKEDAVHKSMMSSLPQFYRTKQIVFHCSLNPNPQEKISDDSLREIARDFMTEMGYANQPYIVFKHNDIEREHIHIVSLRVDSDGKKINDKYEGIRSSKAVRKIEKKYGLIIGDSLAHKNSKTYEIAPVNYKSGNVKSQVSNVVRTLIKEYSFTTLGEFNALLNLYNVKAEIIKTQSKGKEYEGIIYFPITPQGKELATPIKSSDIGKGVGLSAVTGKMERSKHSSDKYMALMRENIIKAMRTNPEDLKALKKELALKEVTLVTRVNEQNRIYGITFIDNVNHVIFNGSRLGKGYGANVFNTYFSKNVENPFFEEEKYPLNQEERTQSPEFNRRETDIPEWVEEDVWLPLLSSNDDFLDDENDIYIDFDYWEELYDDICCFVKEDLIDILSSPNSSLLYPLTSDAELEAKERAWQRKLRRRARSSELTRRIRRRR